MSVQQKILLACAGFVAIIALLGGLAQRQAIQMGRLAISIYDHSFMGMSYVDQTQEEFLRLAAAHHEPDATLAGTTERAALQKVLERLDVALERASSERTREAGVQVRAMLAALPELPADKLAAQMAQVDRAIAKLVKRFSSDGLEARDDAEELTTHAGHLVLIEIAVAVCLALGFGLLLGRNLSRPLVQIVRTIGFLTTGELEHTVAPRLLRRRDEIGAVARATAVFREAMQQNVQAGVESVRQRARSEADKLHALRSAAESMERETRQAAELSVESGALLIERTKALVTTTARVLASAAAVTDASSVALHRSQMVAAAGEELSASAQHIAQQISGTASEIASTARAGERAREIIDRLAAAVGQIGSVARLIGDIAKRTNLLALNATIEAARAGDAGRGFAVVANEVKLLAVQTAQSTNEIARDAGEIQQATRDAVAAVGEMVERVTSIERFTQSVAEAAEQQNATALEVARNIAETADAMRIVSDQIGAVSTEAHHTDAAVTEMRGLAEATGERISTLQGTMVRIVRTSSDAVNRRLDERISINKPATLLLDGRALQATCLDLSRGGARVSVAEILPADARVILRMTGGPALPGKVLDGGTDARLQFDWEPDAAPAELQDMLGLLAAA